MSEINRYVGSRMLILGTPLAVVGFNNDDKKKSLLFDAHIFFDGRTKVYRTFQLESDYQHADASEVPDYINVVNKLVEDEIEKIILDEMAERNIPSHLFHKLVPCDSKDFSVFMYSIWSRGYEDEIKAIAEKSDIGKLRTEFSKITTFTKIKVSFPAAHL